jgi:hypothetical protein
MKGAETIVFGADGTMYVHGRIQLDHLTDFESSDDGFKVTAKGIS